MTRRDPGRCADHKSDSGNACTLHDCPPVLLSLAPGASNCSTMRSTIGITASALNDGSTARRHERPSASANSTVTVPFRSMSRRISPRSAALLQQFDEACPHVRLDVLVDARDGRIAAALRHDLGTERDLFEAALDQMLLRERREAIEEILGAHRREILRRLGAIALGDAGDDLFLGAEVAIEVAGAHAGLGADFLHRGLVEAGTREARLRSSENFAAAVGRELDIGPAHEWCPAIK